jgi:hypothetical protein
LYYTNRNTLVAFEIITHHNFTEQEGTVSVWPREQCRNKKAVPQRYYNHTTLAILHGPESLEFDSSWHRQEIAAFYGTPSFITVVARTNVE